MNLVSRRKTWEGVLVALALLLALPAPRAWGMDVGDVAPNFKVYEEVDEEDLQFYAYVKDRVTLLWIWDWSVGCPV